MRAREEDAHIGQYTSWASSVSAVFGLREGEEVLGCWGSKCLRLICCLLVIAWWWICQCGMSLFFYAIHSDFTRFGRHSFDGDSVKV